ncbi:MAG: resolvase [Spirulina sp.]
MVPESLPSSLSQPVILGLDPGRQKCGLAIMGVDRILRYQEVVPVPSVLPTIEGLRQRFPISTIVLGDQTGSKQWKATLAQLDDPPRIMLVDERYTSLEARDRYWQMYPPAGLASLLPQSFRTIPRPIDDIVAILLIERYLNRLTEKPET